jgi:hypothetical protein
MSLGKLKKVDLRKAWKHEASDFSNWLSQEENLSLLSDEVGIDISLIQTEASVGKFNVDILAEEENTNRKVVIENQLEATNHDHLGKIITYASGFDAEVIIWIVKDVRDEHKQAVDWLNEHTDDKINIFAIKMELWQINDSPFAPKFQIISKPNDWAKAVKKSAGQSNLTDTKVKQLDFWTQFKAYAEDKGTSLSLRSPRPQHWYDISYGNSKSHLTLIADTQNDQVRCELYIPDNKELYNALYEKKDEIEAALGCELDWMALEMKKASRVKAISSADILGSESWETYFDWLLDMAHRFKKVFGKQVAKIN